MKIKPEESSVRLTGIRTYDLCDTGAVLYQLRYSVYHASWELVMLGVHNIPVDDEKKKTNTRKIIYLTRGETFKDINDHHCFVYNLGSRELKPEENSRSERDSNSYPCDTSAAFYQLRCLKAVKLCTCQCL